MSEIISTTVAGIELTTNEQANPVTPRWLGEVLLIGEYWRVTGLLDRLKTQVRVNRARMGQYEVCDFVLLLLRYAVSGLDTLEDIRRQMALSDNRWGDGIVSKINLARSGNKQR